MGKSRVVSRYFICLQDPRPPDVNVPSEVLLVVFTGTSAQMDKRPENRLNVDFLDRYEARIVKLSFFSVIVNIYVLVF